MKNLFKISIVVLVSFLLAASPLMAKKVSRDKQVIFDVDGGRVQNPFQMNYLVPGGTPRNSGLHQAMWEPLFILNYETGKIDPWLGVSMTPNSSQDKWTLKLRNGTKWSDGQDFDADDVVFTIQMLLDDSSGSLNYAGAMQQWIKSIKKQDKRTIVFNLKEANARFQLDYFSVKIWGGVTIMPEHIWRGKDPFTFTFYDKTKGWPIGTGAYKLSTASETEFIYDRDDNWWGAESGWKPLPGPEQLMWVVTNTEETRSMLMTKANLDSVMDITLGAFEAIKARNRNVQAWWDDMPYSWLDPCARVLEINNLNEQWSTPGMRHALNSFINRKQIVEVAYEGTTFASKTMFVEYGGMAPYIDAVVAAGYGHGLGSDPSRGHRIIQAHGWKKGSNGFYQKNGATLEFEIKTHEGYIEKRRIADVLVEQFRKNGIKSMQTPVAGATWLENKSSGDFTSTMGWDQCGSINEPYASMNRMNHRYMRPLGDSKHGRNNFVRWDTENAKKFSKIVDEIGVMPLNAPGMVDMVVEAYSYYYHDLPMIPITQARKLIPFDTTYWTGWPTAKNNYNHPATWWQSTHQIIHNLKKAK